MTLKARFRDPPPATLPFDADPSLAVCCQSLLLLPTPASSTTHLQLLRTLHEGSCTGEASLQARMVRMRG